MVAVALVALLAAVFVDRGRSPAPARSAKPKPQEVRRVHAVLHGIEEACSGSRVGPRVSASLEANANTIVRFARKYPQVRFPIDDESGRALSLLLVAREALLPCAPLAAARVDRALPQKYRKGL